MLSLVLFLILSICVSYFVALPLLNARGRGNQVSNGASNHQTNDLIEQKASLYAAIKEIEFDYEMGKLSEADFKELREQYKDQAIGILRELDKLQGKPVSAKEVHSLPPKDKPSAAGVNYCWICGTDVTSEDRFCADCGNELTGTGD